MRFARATGIMNFEGRLGGVALREPEASNQACFLIDVDPKHLTLNRVDRRASLKKGPGNDQWHSTDPQKGAPIFFSQIPARDIHLN